MAYDAKFLYKAADVRWLRETHLKHILGTAAIKSFSLLGNEDCPERVMCYGSVYPMWNEKPLAVYVLDPSTMSLIEK